MAYGLRGAGKREKKKEREKKVEICDYEKGDRRKWKFKW